MEIKQLAYFLAVAEQKSFTKAAATLRVAQPALGLQIRRLETELGTQLLARHSRGVLLTEAGTLLIERARYLMEHIDQTKAEIRNLAPTISGGVVLGIAPSISAMLSYSLVSAVAEKLPDIALVLVEGSSTMLAEWVGMGRLDLALGYDILNGSNVAGDALFIESLYLVQTRDKKTRSVGTVPFAALEGRKLLLPCKPHAIRVVLEQHAAERGFALTVKFEMQSVFVTKQLVERGVGEAVLPYGVTRNELERGTLSVSKIIDPEFKRTASLIRHARKVQSKAGAAVERLIRETVAREAEINGKFWQSVMPSAATRTSGKK